MFLDPKRSRKTLIFDTGCVILYQRNHITFWENRPMAETMQKIKLMKLYELLQKETDSEHAISRTVLCQRFCV